MFQSWESQNLIVLYISYLDNQLVMWKHVPDYWKLCDSHYLALHRCIAMPSTMHTLVLCLADIWTRLTNSHHRLLWVWRYAMFLSPILYRTRMRCIIGQTPAWLLRNLSYYFHLLRGIFIFAVHHHYFTVHQLILPLSVSSPVFFCWFLYVCIVIGNELNRSTP